MPELVKIDLLFVKIAPQIKKLCSAGTDGGHFGKRCFSRLSLQNREGHRSSFLRSPSKISKPNYSERTTQLSITYPGVHSLCVHKSGLKPDSLHFLGVHRSLAHIPQTRRRQQYISSLPSHIYNVQHNLLCYHNELIHSMISQLVRVLSTKASNHECLWSIRSV